MDPKEEIIVGSALMLFSSVIKNKQLAGTFALSAALLFLHSSIQDIQNERKLRRRLIETKAV